MLALDVAVVLVILIVFVSLIIFLDKRNRGRAVFKYQKNRQKGAENLEVAVEEQAQRCDRCQKAVNAEKDLFDGKFWRHVDCSDLKEAS